MAPKSVKNTALTDPFEFPYQKPQHESGWESFKKEIYDPSRGAILGRTPTNWAALTLFYIIFFSAIAAMFAICMWGLLKSCSETEPTYKLDNSIIGNNPGLGFRPLSSDVEKSGSLIWYQAKNEENYKTWTKALDAFLQDYEKQGGENRMICSNDNPPTPGKVCAVPLDSFGPCTKANGYSYNQSSPCVFIKLNRIFNWVPEYYNDSESLPDDMGADLKEYIKSLPAKERNHVWVSCEGETVADNESIGPMTFYPGRGFPGFYYPYRNTPGYLSPLIAVHFERPLVNRLINVDCRAWAKNIRYVKSRREPEGTVHFEIMID